MDFQVIPFLIDKLKIEAWAIAGDRSYLRTSYSQGGMRGFYDRFTKEIYIVNESSGWDIDHRRFAHEATHAIQDYRNVPHPRTLRKYMEADAYIVQAAAGIHSGRPFKGHPTWPQDVATGGAAKLLSTPVRARGPNWRNAFRKAYDDVVDAYVALLPNGVNRLARQEKEWEQKRDERVLKNMLKVLQGKKDRGEPHKWGTLDDI